ncbi:origin recognition complex subunit 2 isoform X1 [Zootoca vivipara]|uniref:origin recognition complex subunit 2 isoform X1 n=1 Tax=Zootoca vivipara TaxID=8524 RepID=UPI00293BB6FB|nr:origin recognition complex subunit 2 isoform X1 [Zootoca vivipara]XP_034992821.2 origin recognition complex subunit 2 isoform X1 [Zootoca vivipara]XP_034992847.2 origin recognition complex subunit 2 isoform X1 [Zootoca vivipara]XP_034992864.2 origin recognition complex subunit 2 isoform X1 [Zootoca vivipara]XP_034992868.2 origin recognition complex subunit 2 isoform X1 [Zootoca vivipara]XP_034992871.2 origin recognition complex subunit 2 isoform X1 [Zootoca vivipara]XP_060137591.1 origin r
MSNPKLKKSNVIEVKFVADEDVVKHISEDAGHKARKNKAAHTLDAKRWVKKTEDGSDNESRETFEEQDYVSVLGIQGSLKNGSSAGGGDFFPFQTPKRSNRMAEMASELAQTAGSNVKHEKLKDPEKGASTPQSSNKYSASSKGKVEQSKKNEFISKTPYRLRKRITALNMCSDTESDYSTSCSEEEDDDSCKETTDNAVDPKLLARPQTSSATANKETPAKKLKREVPNNLVEEYFEAHGSSKVLTSDRTLQKLQKEKLDQESLQNILKNVPVAFASECEALTKQHESLFYKWMLQLHLGFNIVLYGLGSKKALLENFRISLLQDSVHIVVNGFFPSITVKSILNSVTEEVLDHVGTFRNSQDQLDLIVKRFKEDPSLELYLLIHNLDSPTLRGDKNQQILAQLSCLSNIYLIASIDHINAPLMWDQAKQSMYNWLWYETTTYSPYVEETSFENSLLIQQSGSLALSSLTHVLRSLTPNARGIFRLLAEYQLENKDNTSYPGLSFQDFYQQCREAFLVNSDLTLRAQLTEFRDHKLIRTKRGADGVEYLLIPVDAGTLTDFLQKDNDV